MKQTQVGQRLRELRRQRGLPISVLAKLSRCSPQAIVNCERWGIPLPHKIAAKIARVLEVSPEELLPEPEQEVRRS